MISRNYFKTSRGRSPLIILVVLAVILLVFGYRTFFTGRKGHRPNIVFLMLDTTRASHLGFYGYERPTSPFLDSLAKENLAFSYALTSSPWTPPAVASMMSGLYVSSHGLMPPDSREQAAKSTKLNPDLYLLPEVLKDAGYQTAAVSPNPWINATFGFDQGYDKFIYMARAPADQISAAGKDLIKEFKETGKPFFLYLHYLDPHQPYDPPAEYRNIYQPLSYAEEYSKKSLKRIDLYDGEIKYLDDQLKELFDYFKSEGLYEDLMVIIVGDHGEQFKEHGNYGHGNQLFNEEVHIPLIIKTGSNPVRKTIDYTVSVVDIYPTVLDVLGVRPSDKLPGVSLLNEKNLGSRSGVISEIFRKYVQKAFIDYQGRKIIVGRKDPKLALTPDNLNEYFIGVYDRNTDYKEKASLKDTDLKDELGEELKNSLLEIEKYKRDHSAGNAEISEETLRQLESLGYLK